MIKLFRNYFVIFISFLSSAALAVGPKPTLSEASSHTGPRVQAPFLNTGSRFRPYPQLSSSSSSSPRVPQGFNALFTAIAMVQSAPEQVASAFLSHHVVPLPPLSPRPNRMAISELLSPRPNRMAISELLLPDSTVPSSSSHAPRSEEEAPASSLQEISAPQQGENEARFVLSAPNLEETAIEEKLEELRGILANLKGRSLRLRVRYSYFSRVSAIVTQFYNPASFPSITLELCRFRMRRDEGYDDKPLIKFLEVISPTLKKISFINCDISSTNMGYLINRIRDKKGDFLENIVEFKYTNQKVNTDVAPTFVSKLFETITIKNLKNLENISFNIKEMKENGEKPPSFIEILNRFIKMLLNKDIKTLTFSGGFFDETIIEIFINKLIEAKKLHFQEINILETHISEDRLRGLFEKLDQKYFSFTIIKKPDISGAGSDVRITLLQPEVAEVDQ